MYGSYQLKYCGQSLKNGKGFAKCLKARAIQYGTSSSDPMEQRYFYGVEEGPPERYVCFIKRFVSDEDRYESERKAARISSPYVAAPYMVPCRMEYSDNGIWSPLEGKVILYKYLPCDLTSFGEAHPVGEEVRDAYRRDILLKLIQGVGHMHQARIIHHDIKPGNILVNCRGLCDKAPWTREDLDVRLTDFDSIYDGDGGKEQLDAGTKPFQPPGNISPSVWLDIYSLCMVALWLYDSREDYLTGINRAQPKTAEEIERIMKRSRTTVPTHIRQILVPHLVRASSRMAGPADKSQWEAGAEELSALYQALSGALSGGGQPAELLGPAEAPAAWSAVVHVDQELWPVYGQGREYRALPITRWLSGRDESVTSVGESGCLELSGPPEIVVAGNHAGGVWSLKAGIYGRVNESAWPLVRWRRLLEGEDVELYCGMPVGVSGSRTALFQSVAVRDVHLYSGEETPEVLPPFRGPVPNETADINLVLIMMVSQLAGSGAGRRLVRHVADEVSKIAGYDACYYGFTVRQGDEQVYSFCRGLRNPTGEELSALYSDSACGTRAAKGGDAFDSGLPAVVIGYWDHPQDWDAGIVRRFKNEIASCFPHAVQYLQIFTTDMPDLTADMRKLLPHLATAVEPDGACVLTPLPEGDGFPDPKGRWLAAVRYWCQRGAGKRKGGTEWTI